MDSIIKIFFVACCVFFSCFSVIVFANPDAVLKNNSVVQNTRYFSGDYEETTDAVNPSNSNKVHSIYCTEGIAAIYVIPPSGGGGALYYPFTDHLGSILKVTDENGTAAGEQSFDAYGRNRNPADWNDYTAIPAVPAWLPLRWICLLKKK